MGIMNLSWFEVDELIDNMILDIVEKDYTIEQVCGVARGGLIPGVIISQRLGVPFVPLEWQTRDGKRKDEMKLIQTFRSHSNTLIVDDLIDSGTTYIGIMNIVNNHCTNSKALFGTLLNKKEEIALDIVGCNVYNIENWIQFPWEKT
jgi:hypoxanthine phosphoribosyltransferase